MCTVPRVNENNESDSGPRIIIIVHCQNPDIHIQVLCVLGIFQLFSLIKDKLKVDPIGKTSKKEDF